MLGVRRINTSDSIIALPSPLVYPVTRDEFKLSQRVSTASEDTLIDTWIAAASQWFELETDRTLIATVRERTLDHFPYWSEIELPYPPLMSVTSIKYDDTSGVEQTLDPASYRVITPAGPYCRRGRIALYSGGMWPATAYQPKSVRIRYVAGYGDSAAQVPEIVKAAVHLLGGHLYKFRTEVFEAERAATLISLPLGAQTLIRSFRETARETLPPMRGGW